MTSHARFGFFSALGAYFIWGALPLYIRSLDNIGAGELLVHRVLWSVPTAVALIVLAARWRDVQSALQMANLKWLMLSGLLIGGNWLVYIWAVNQNRTMEAAIGYYINPLVNVLFGLLFFSERLRPAQWASVAIAGIGVGVATIAYGHVPWAALFLCFSFAFYSVIRKQVQVDSRAGFFVEVMVLAPLAFVWLLWFVQAGEGRWLGGGGLNGWLLPLAGPVTATPLILFALAAKRLRLSTLGMMQYIGPTIQFLIATFIFKEPFGWVHGTAFACIWAALAIFTMDSVVGEAKARRISRTPI